MAQQESTRIDEVEERKRERERKTYASVALYPHQTRTESRCDVTSR